MKPSWSVLLMAAGSLQLIIVAFYSALSRAKFPKQGLRRSERVLIVSSAIAALASLTLIDIRALLRPRAAVTQASTTAATSQGSCASIEVGMAESEVTKRLGPPTQRIVDEETRGPGATVLLYKSSRCAVKVLNGSVEVVE
jgi:hypothetical protein